MRKSIVRRSIALLLFLSILMTFQPVHPALAVVYLQIIRTDTGEQFNFVIDTVIPIADFKATLEKVTGIPAQCQELWFYVLETQENIVVPGDFVMDGTETSGEGTWNLTPTCSAAPAAPKPLYTLWILTHADGSRCLLFSESAPSVEVQNAKCFPQKYNNSWVAARSCGAEVFDDGFWDCKGVFDAWQETLPLVLRTGLPTPD